MEPKIDQATEAVIEQIIDSAVHYRILPLQGSDWERVLPMLRAVPDLLEACKAVVNYPALKMSPEVFAAGKLCLDAVEKAEPDYLSFVPSVWDADDKETEPDPLDAALDACDGEIDLVDP